MFAKLKAHRPLSRGTRSCNSPTSAASDQWVDDGRAGGVCGDAGSTPALLGSSPYLGPALGGPVSGQQGRRSGRRAPIGREAGGGGAGAVPGAGLPGGQCRPLFQDIDALASARVGRTAI